MVAHRTCRRRAVQRWLFPLTITLLAVSVEGQGDIVEAGYAPTIESNGQELDPPDEVIDELYGGGDLGEQEPADEVRQEKEMGKRNRVLIAQLEEKELGGMTTTLPPIPGYNEYTNDWGATVTITPDTNDPQFGGGASMANVGQAPQPGAPYGQNIAPYPDDQASMLQTQTGMEPPLPPGMSPDSIKQYSMLAAQQNMSPDSMPDPDMIAGHSRAGAHRLASMLQQGYGQGISPVKGSTPEAIPNILNYELQEPTPPPPPLAGVYMRGGAAQYRVPPPLPLGVIVKPFPQIIFPNNRREFCHGLSCIPKLGWPPKYDAGFTLLCQRLFEYHGGGYLNTLADKQGLKNLDDLKQAVIHWCKLRTPGDQHVNCPAYGDVFVAANAGLIDKPTVSGSAQVCNNLHFWMGGMKGAETNLKLRKELLPDGFALVQSEPYGLNRFGGGGVGPNSIHGRAWRKVLQKRGYQFPEGKVPDVATIETTEPLPGAPRVSLVMEKSETEESLKCRTAHAAAFLQEAGYGMQHGAPVPALADKVKKTAPAPGAAGTPPPNQQVSFAQAPAPAADINAAAGMSDEQWAEQAAANDAHWPAPPGWPVPPPHAAPKVRKPPTEALQELYSGVAESASYDEANAAAGYAPGSPSQVDPDETGVLSDNPPPSDYGVLKPFGVHHIESAPQTLQSFGANPDAPQSQNPPPIALQQNPAQVSAADEQAAMSPSDPDGNDPDENSVLSDNPGMPSDPPSFLQKISKKKDEEKIPDYTYPQWDPLYRSGGRPKYDQHFPCRNGINKPNQRDVMYQLLPPVPWPINLPPVEIAGNMLQFCSSEFSEIMAGFPQTADTIVDMTGSWCSWQASMTSWVGRAQELGHPEWNFRTCAGMQYFVAWLLRNELGTSAGRPAGFVCSKYFLSIGAMYTTEKLIKDAWSGPSGRVLDNTRLAVSGGGGGGPDKELMRAMQEYAEALFSKMRGQRDAFMDMNGAKMDESAFDQPPTGAPPPMDKPPLPDSADFDAFIQTHMARMQNHSMNMGWHDPPPAESPPTHPSFLGSMWGLGQKWAGAPSR